MASLEQRIDDVVRRSRAFYRAEEPGHFLVCAHVAADLPPIPPLHQFDLDEQLGEWLDCRLEAARAGWRAKEGVDDDLLPSICPHFGIAEHSAWLGMEVILQETTCLPIPALDTPEDLDRIRLSEESKWFRYMKEGYAHLQSRKDGTFLVSLRGTMFPMDLANAFRGDELFVDFLEDPAFSHRLMAFLVEALDWYYPRLWSWADDVQGGRIMVFGGGWMPEGALGHTSNDAAMLCSPTVYEAFGYPYESRICEGYDHVMLHVHNARMHAVPRMADLPNLSLLEVAHDPNTAMPIEDLDRILAATGSANLMLGGDSEQVRVHIDELKERNVVLRVACRDRQDAEDIVAFVRDQSNPLEVSS